MFRTVSGDTPRNLAASVTLTRRSDVLVLKSFSGFQSVSTEKPESDGGQSTNVGVVNRAKRGRHPGIRRSPPSGVMPRTVPGNLSPRAARLGALRFVRRIKRRS